MKNLSLTVDCQAGLLRAALWEKGRLFAFRADRIGAPDQTGALCGARIVRVTKGGAAWAEAGLDEKLYLENAAKLQAGDCVRLRIEGPARQGKAYPAKLEGENAEEIGLLVPPPPLWAKLLQGKGQNIASIRIEGEKEHAACAAWLKTKAPALLSRLQAVEKKTPHPELDDLLVALRSPRVALSGGGSLVIEQTEALVSIDVNAGEAQNPLAANLAAVPEIVRQIRLRNLSGLIVVDALKMQARADGSKLLNALRRAGEGDDLFVHDLTKLGLLELTRPRRGLSLFELFASEGESDSLGS